MLKSLKLFFVAAAMSSIASSAHAVTFYPSEENFLDFGKVAVGDSSLIMWEISWTLEVDPASTTNELEKIDAPYATIGYSDDFTVNLITCSIADALCTFNVLFTPSKLGKLNADPLVRVDLGIGSYTLQTTGEGISPVPLPAALPLLGGALSLLGYFGWRRKPIAPA